MKDLFYIDYLNQATGNGDNIGTDSKALTNTSNTIRLYTTQSDYTDPKADKKTGLGNLKDLILVAPYSTPIGISGTNSFDTGNTDPLRDIMNNLTDQLNQGREFVRGVIRSLRDGYNMAKTLINEPSKALTVSRGGSGEGVLESVRKAPTDVSMSTPSAVTKSYINTTINLPIDSISVTYLSDPTEDGWANSKFAWLGSYSETEKGLHTELKTTVQVKDPNDSSKTKPELVDYYVKVDSTRPLKTMAKYLSRVLLGQISVDDSGSVIMYEAPNHYASTPGLQTNYGKNALSLCIGNGIVITNLIPTALSMEPSRYLTTYGDFYSLSISVQLDISRYILSDEIEAWIDNTGYNPGKNTSVSLTESMKDKLFPKEEKQKETEPMIINGGGT